METETKDRRVCGQSTLPVLSMVSWGHEFKSFKTSSHHGDQIQALNPLCDASDLAQDKRELNRGSQIVLELRVTKLVIILGSPSSTNPCAACSGEPT